MIGLIKWIILIVEIYIFSYLNSYNIKFCILIEFCVNSIKNKNDGNFLNERKNTNISSI